MQHVLLAIDVGNTNITVGIFEEKVLKHQFRIESARQRTPDEYAVLFHQLFELHHVNAAQLSAAMIASVVPTLTDTVIEWIRKSYTIRCLVVGPGTKTGVAVLIDNPKEVGADRIVNAVAAHDRVQQNATDGTPLSGVIVVDFGTATTFDIVSPKGEYVGGIICPGIAISADALFQRAAKLPRVEVAKPPRIIGKNTAHAIQSGLFYGYVSMVDGMVERIRSELMYPTRVVATGSYARLIAPASTTLEEVDDDLTLVGLRMIYERNRLPESVRATS